MKKDQLEENSGIISWIIKEDNRTELHFLIDAGAPCTESMIDAGVRAPHVLFITHSHYDHVSDLGKLLNSKRRGRQLLGLNPSPLPVICTEECLDGLKRNFEHLEGLLKWISIPTYDVWYFISRQKKLLPADSVSRLDLVYPVGFKALPVYHPHAIGACLFIFWIKKPSKRIVISGDFETIEDRVKENPDLKDPDLLILETNTIRATGTNHTNWTQNQELVREWASGSRKVRVLLTHISGFEDWEQRFYQNVPTDQDWDQAIRRSQLAKKVTVEVAQDGNKYLI